MGEATVDRRPWWSARGRAVLGRDAGRGGVRTAVRSRFVSFPARCQACWRRFVTRVGWALCAGPVRVASPVGGASWLGEPGRWGACACLVMGRGFWQGTPEEARPAWVTLPENQVLRRFGPPAPCLPPLLSSRWHLVRASLFASSRWDLDGTSLSACWPLFAGLCRVLLHYDAYRRKD